jgi:alpha-L-fucosidase
VQASVPRYLSAYEELYRKDPKSAGLAWFRDAKFGLFVHYGLVSLLPGGKTGRKEGDPSEMELRARYTAAKFDANAIADLAVEAGMRYICFTAYHGGGPYNFRSAVAHPNSFDDLPAKRDLLAEMAEACKKRGLGFFIYVHWSITPTEPDVLERNREIFREWCSKYGPVAGFWFDAVGHYVKNKKPLSKFDETFQMIRELQPQALISLGHGARGDEDYITYEHRLRDLADYKFMTDDLRRRLAVKPIEIVTTMQLDRKDGLGIRMWFNVEGAYHRNAEEIWSILAKARRDNCNLMINTGLLGDGSVPPADAEALREVGRRLRASGFPSDAGKAPISQEGEDR